VIAYYLLRELPPGADPLGEENVLVFAPGVLTGAPFAGSGRNSVGARSPLTGAYGDGEAGGFWGAELKRAGYDAIVITGKASTPVYLAVCDEWVELRDATSLSGRPTAEVQAEIKRQLGDDRVRVAQCGPAGERLVRYACVTHDLRHFAGRCGMGAVMGAKNLRAVAVRGSGTVEVSDPDRLGELRRWLQEHLEELAGGLRDKGTAGIVMGLNAAGGLPTRNFRQGSFEDAEQISGETLRDTLLVGRESCFACPIRCKRVVELAEPYRVDPVYGGPEYETIAALGSTCGVGDLRAIAKANELCAAYGLDTISCGVTIGFAMECFENGILREQDTDGLVLRFGNAEAMVKLVEMIGRREGIGDLLAEGVKRAASQLGHDAEKLAIHVKGQEVPMHEPRLKHALGLGYAVSPTGADHCHNMHDTIYAKEGRSLDQLKSLGILEPLPADDLSPRKVRMFKAVTRMRHLYNCLVVCYFVPWSFEQTVDLVRAVTGWNSTISELLDVGERAIQMTRCFNVLHGFGPADDYLNPRFFEAFTDGPLAGKAVDRRALEEAKRTYYGMMGWQDDGKPRPEKLWELGLDWLVEKIS